MKPLMKRPLVLIALLLLMVYVGAEIVIRGNALNSISCGIGGYLFWGGIALLGYCWIILPILRFSFFPEWIEPETIADPCKRIRYLEKTGKYYLALFAEKRPPEIADLTDELKSVLGDPHSDAAEYQDALLRIIPEIHRLLADVVCDRIIRDYIKKTAVLVCISQRGWLDSVAMLVMQIRMIIDLNRSLGYRPTWYSILKCTGWVFVNSIAFAIFDGTDIVENAIHDLLPIVVGKSVSTSLPIVGKTTSILAQGVSAMAIVYATGKIVQRRLTGSRKRLSGKERIQYRIDGYKMAGKILIFPKVAGKSIDS
ncbi:MAG: YcjF family protein [Victivallaceae bacterium]|nr:YcjF family protein [Victivallaceae bacterium]